MNELMTLPTFPLVKAIKLPTRVKLFSYRKPINFNLLRIYRDYNYNWNSNISENVIYNIQDNSFKEIKNKVYNKFKEYFDYGIIELRYYNVTSRGFHKKVKDINKINNERFDIVKIVQLQEIIWCQEMVWTKGVFKKKMSKRLPKDKIFLINTINQYYPKVLIKIDPLIKKFIKPLFGDVLQIKESLIGYYKHKEAELNEKIISQTKDKDIFYGFYKIDDKIKVDSLKEYFNELEMIFSEKTIEAKDYDDAMDEYMNNLISLDTEQLEASLGIQK